MSARTRKDWSAALIRVPKARVLALAERLGAGLDPQPEAVPRAGLQLLTMRDAVAEDLYYLGEIPVSSARVSLRAPDGARVEGGAVIMVDDAEYAGALAILDAILSHRLPGHEEAAALVAEGLAERARIEAERQTMLTRTKVDFSLMSEAPDEPA